MLVNMGMDFNAAKAEAEKANKPAPNGTYSLQVKVIDCAKDEVQRVDKNGAPYWLWQMNIVNHEDPNINGKYVSHFTYIPNGEDCSRCQPLMDIMGACGLTWDGEFETNDANGVIFDANLGTTKDGAWNEIVSFVA